MIRYRLYEILADGTKHDTEKTVSTATAGFSKELVKAVFELYRFDDYYAGYYTHRAYSEGIGVQYNFHQGLKDVWFLEPIKQAEAEENDEDQD